MSQIAVVYLTVFAGAGTVFVFCSFWVYHYVDLEFDEREDYRVGPSQLTSSGALNTFGMSEEGGSSSRNPNSHDWRLPRRSVRHETM